MSFRTVVISNRCKLTYKNGYMVVRSDELTMIHLSEIYALVIDTTAVSISSYLLNELSQLNIAVIVCDNQRNPVSQMLPLYGHHHSSKNIRIQSEWSEENKQIVWTQIVSNKIYSQAKHLKDLNKPEAELLFSYLENIEINDSTNREGHSAKVYFNALFGKDFNRDKDNNINAALNYGYSILLSLFNKEIIASGYITQIGIKHKNEYNSYNLSCDMMEPFRVLIDRFVVSEYPFIFNQEFKYDILSVFNKQYSFLGGKYYLSSIIGIYIKQVLSAIETGEFENIQFIDI